MQYNLAVPINGPLPYPHYTRMANGEAHVVTHPDKLFKEADIICFNENLATMGHPYRVVAILEQRNALGQHSVDFVPVFQKLKVVSDYIK
jgi:hypothetical protein